MGDLNYYSLFVFFPATQQAGIIEVKCLTKRWKQLKCFINDARFHLRIFEVHIRLKTSLWFSIFILPIKITLMTKSIRFRAKLVILLHNKESFSFDYRLCSHSWKTGTVLPAMSHYSQTGQLERNDRSRRRGFRSSAGKWVGRFLINWCSRTLLTSPWER